MNENTLTNKSLPTQNSEARGWGEWPHPPLTLRETLEVSPVQFAWPTVAVAPSSRRPSLARQFLLLGIITVLCVICYQVVSRHIATAVIVQGRSMLPTLHDGDRFILNRLSYFRHAPQRGDVVVVKDPGHNDYAVKRIVGMPSETVYFKRGEVMVNGKRLFEPYLVQGTQTFLPDTREKLIMVGKDQYFVLGDNRGNSEDSRYYGAVNKSQIVGAIVR